MKKLLLLIILFINGNLNAADLPTVTVEHLYYLQARSARVHKFKAEDMIDYCIVQKLGGNAFESLYFQLFTNRVDLAKLLKVERVEPQDPRVIELNKTYEALFKLLSDEAGRIRSGIVNEGQIASDALQTIALSQQPR